MQEVVDAATVPPQYNTMLASDGHANTRAFLHASNELLRGLELRGKRVLEIGSGKGLMSALIGLAGAGKVVSMEPELAGATSGAIQIQRERIDQLGLSNVEVVIADFNTWETSPGSFDVIVSRSSINHLHQSERHALTDSHTYASYQAVASRIHRLLAPGGVFVATDACRYAFFTAVRNFGIRRPWHPVRTGVNWRHHQNPGTWKRIFRSAGFSRVTVNFPVPYRLRKAGLLVDTRVMNFFLKGTFILRAYK